MPIDSLTLELIQYLTEALGELTDNLPDPDDVRTQLHTDGFLTTGHRVEMTVTIYPKDPDRLNN
jgi:hypothetical protein